MAIKAISQFDAATPTSNDKILFEQNGEGKSATIGDVGKAIGINMELLWSNSAVSSVFVPQKISLDLSGYSCVRLLVIVDGTSANRTIVIWDLPKGFNYRITANYSAFRRRKVIVSDTGIDFSDCEVINDYGGGTTSINNNTCVPYQIWGIK